MKLLLPKKLFIFISLAFATNACTNASPDRNALALLLTLAAEQSVDRTLSVSLLKGDGTLTLNWNQMNDTSSTEASTYRVYYSQSSAFDTVDEVETGTPAMVESSSDISSLSITGLSNIDKYYFNVVVEDPEGNKSVYTKLGETWKDDLEAYYTFNGNPNDETNNFFDGVANGFVLGATDRFGTSDKAYYFDGSNAYISLSSGLSLDNKSWTISAWIKSDTATPSNSYFLGTTDGVVSGANLSLYLGFRDSTSLTNAFLDNDLDANYTHDLTWKQMVVSYNTTTMLRKIYLDGVLLSSDTSSAHYQGTADFRVGASLGYAYFFKGSVDDLRFYTRSLSDTEVTELYDMEKL